MLRKSLFACSVSAFVLAAPVYAGETPLYVAAPEWVQKADISADDIADSPAEILLDWQHRLEGGTVTSYRDRAVRIDNPGSLDSEGTLNLTWSPDKGDLRIHQLEIVRGGEVLDLVADGVEFEVIRREQGLEQRLLDGRLTATVAVPGLREGDVLRLAHSTTLADQALGDEMQEAQYLPAKPYRVGMGRAIISWPVDSDVVWQAGPDVELPEPETRDGYRWLTAEFPLAKRPEFPRDAPSRFSRVQLIRVGTFADWTEMSRVMSPHYEAAAILDPDGEVAEEVAGIMNVTDDPVERMALAARVVQDQISYLLDGLDGGNYLPQDAEDTWSKKYGDCKAKSVLLLSMLRAMGIDADPVLVVSRGGDAMPDLLPIPANFDHMIVRAQVDGVGYWIDGTSSATRSTNIDEVPAFFYALPLKPEGTDLVPMTQRQQTHPDMVMTIDIDHSAGVDLPALFTLTADLYGPAGAQFEQVSDADDPDILRRIGRQFSSSMGDAEVTDISISYDKEAAVSRLSVSGVTGTMFTYQGGKLELEKGTGGTARQFNPDRARPAWREIPVQTRGPSRTHASSTITLPQDGAGFSISGTLEIDATAANMTHRRTASLVGAELKVSEVTIGELGEIGPADLTEQKLAVRRMATKSIEVETPDDIVWRWDLSIRDLAERAAPLVEAYAIAVEDAEDDDFGPLLSRSRFFRHIYHYENALTDIDAILAEEPTAALYAEKAHILMDMERNDDALLALGQAYDVDPANGTAFLQAELMSRLGQHDEALALMDLLPITEDERDSFAENLALNQGRAGAVNEGLLTITDRLAEESENSGLLNADCWYRGLHAIELGTALLNCTRAIERSEYPANALDSRALVHYRRGDMVSALEDLDAALKLSPAMAAARFMRGIIRLEQGDQGGREDIAAAQRLSPATPAFYELYDILPK